MAESIEIDGSHGEGGGQVLRTALTLSALTGRPVRLRQIRAARPKPGLAPQHLTCVRAAARICDASLHGAELRSTELTFEPRSEPLAGEYVFDVTEASRGGSAGAATLVFQTVFLPLALARGESRLTLKGGTHVPWSPTFDFLAAVFLPAVARMGFNASCTLEAPGFYPIGGGRMTSVIAPSREADRRNPGGANAAPTAAPPEAWRPAGIRPLTLNQRGALQAVSGRAVACNLPADIAQRMANRAANVLREAGLSPRITAVRERGPGPGAFVFLTAEYENAVAGFSALGDRGKPADRVADEACQALLAHHQSGAAVDPHLADQLLLPLALASERSGFGTSRVTGHLLTNAHVIQQFGRVVIRVTGTEGQPGAVLCETGREANHAGPSDD